MWLRLSSNYFVYQPAHQPAIGTPFDPNALSNQSIKSFHIFPGEETHETFTSKCEPLKRIGSKLVSDLPSTQTERKWNLVKTKLRRSTKQFSICLDRSTLVTWTNSSRKKKEQRSGTIQTNYYPISRKKKKKQKHFRQTNVWKNLFVLSCFLSLSFCTRTLTGHAGCQRCRQRLCASKSKRKVPSLVRSIWKQTTVFGKCRWKMPLLGFTIVLAAFRCIV